MIMTIKLQAGKCKNKILKVQSGGGNRVEQWEELSYF